MNWEETAAYAASKALRELGVKTESGKVYVNDFTKTPVVIPGDTPAYMNHISGEMPDLSKAVVKIDLYGDIIEKAVTDMFYEAVPDIQVQEVRFTENAPPIMLVFGSVVANEMELAPGLYLSAGTEQVRLISVKLPEIVHPIDPKFLPGVCLPVVEITPEQMDEIPSGGVKTYSEGPLYEQFENVFHLGLPWVLRIPFETGVTNKIVTGEDENINGLEAFAYSCTLWGFRFVAARAIYDGSVIWYCAMEEMEAEA